ncbi:MAG: hypothetical protein ACPGVX_05140 [Thalassobaculaceae bacterium]
MILEALQALRVGAGGGARRMGFLTECVGIWARQRRHGTAWADHQARSKAAILAALPPSPRRRALVFGAALILDVPLAELAGAFDEVVLVDLMFLPATRRAAERLGNVILCVHDVSESLAGIEAGRPQVAAPTRFHDDPTIDLVVSANLLSQLPIVPNAYLTRKFAWDEPACAALGRKLVDAHLTYLAEFRCAVVLISDVERLVEDREGREIARFSALFDRPLDWPGEEWLWPVAPLGEVDRNHRVTHRVRACRRPPDSVRQNP